MYSKKELIKYITEEAEDDKMNEMIKNRILQGKQKAINYIDAGGSSSSCDDELVLHKKIDQLSSESYETLLADED